MCGGGRLLELCLGFEVVWVKLGASIGDGDDVTLGSMPASLVKGGDLDLSDGASGLTRSTSSLNSLAADLVRVYDGLVFVDKSNDGRSSSLDKKRTYHVHRRGLDPWSRITVWNRGKTCEG